ncbi:hypothetical protein Pyrfu_0941 [Pyrolobus fumarii 1A]|uniref:Uncharacterized protein n=2 Tax=Pyrolobus fumarii TaxID=54252 RepID=G0EEB6_PYRF1|nr:hypothetical protein Pyrfu_0941 [Pyrolobus fumarii 1A]
MATTMPSTDIVSTLMDMLLLTLIVLFSVSILLATMKKQQEPKPRLRTRIECMRCGYRLEREYSKGDYVGLEDGECPKCGGKLIVVAVYEERPGEKEEQRILSLIEKTQRKISTRLYSRRMQRKG